jgi:hypothetical protein
VFLKMFDEFALFRTEYFSTHHMRLEKEKSEKSLINQVQQLYIKRYNFEFGENLLISKCTVKLWNAFHMVHYVSATLGKNFNTPNVSKFHDNNCIND